LAYIQNGVPHLELSVNQKMVETARDIRNVTTSKVAVLAAMNLAEELLTLHQSIDRSNRAAAERIDKLVGLSKSLASSPAEETEPDQHES